MGSGFTLKRGRLTVHEVSDETLLRDLSLASIGVENVQAPGSSAVKGTGTRVREVERRLRLDSS